MDSYALPPPIYPPLQVASHRARRFVPTLRAPHTQALTSRPRSRSSFGTGWGRWCSGAETESPRIPDAWHPDGSGNVVMIASGPTIPSEQ
jgi:hypothetical protein